MTTQISANRSQRLSRRGFVDGLCVILQVHFVAEFHITSIMRAIEWSVIIKASQMSILKMPLQSPSTMELLQAAFHRTFCRPRAEDALGRAAFERKNVAMFFLLSSFLPVRLLATAVKSLACTMSETVWTHWEVEARSFASLPGRSCSLIWRCYDAVCFVLKPAED